MLYFVCSQLTDMEHYMLDAIKIPHVCLLIPVMEVTLGRRVLHLGWKFGMNLKCRIYEKFFYNQLLQVKEDDVVVLFMVENKEPVLNIVSWLPRKTRKIVWFWNSVNDGLEVSKSQHSMQFDVRMMKKVGCKIATFDPFDAEIFDIQYIPQFFNFKGIPSLRTFPDYDFYFLGNSRGKYRERMLNEIKSELEKFHFKFKELLRGTTMQDYITYQENLENVSNAKCVIDIERNNQVGLSLRPLESLAMNRKLLTTNLNIKNYDFYNSDNIFIWGVDNNSKLISFLNNPYRLQNSSIVYEYDVNRWLLTLIS